MSNPHLPAELLDHIVGFLRDTEYALRSCCLVSKSWIPRTRKHLFADIQLDTKEDAESWKQIFPDPSTSPACYTKTLLVSCPRVVTAADVEVGGWIRGFSRVVYLKVVGLDIGCSLASLSRPILQIFTRHQIPPHDSSYPSVFAGFRSHSFIPSSQGLGCAHQQNGDRR